MAAVLTPSSKTNWADDVAENDVPAAKPLEEPKIQSSVDANGVMTTVEYRTNDDGKRVKITRKIKRTLVTTHVNHEVAERKATWAKFGAEKGKKAGPDLATTTVGENIRIKLSPANKAGAEPEGDKQADLKAQLSGRKIACRLCQGDHYTTRCPYKDTLGGLEGETDADFDSPAPGGAAGGGSGTGKYVPPSQRLGAKAGGETMYGKSGNRDEMPTLRVTNLSEDTSEDDLWALFGRFGRINRIFVGIDMETRLCKGFAFVSFDDKASAEAALSKINGLPYDHLILRAEFSGPREPRPER